MRVRATGMADSEIRIEAARNGSDGLVSPMFKRYCPSAWPV